MPAEPPGLLIVSNSGRAMAEAAVRGGYSVAVVDGFCDEDTRAVASCTKVPMSARGLDESRLRFEVDRLMPTKKPFGLVYGAGLEQTPGTLAWLAERFALFGNGPDVLQLLQQPARFFALLDDLGIRYPETCFVPPPTDAAWEWLTKEAGSSGGLGVRRWRVDGERPAGEHYFQRFLDGPVVSVLFVADGTDCSVIGFNRLMVASGGDRPFLYGGAVSHAVLTAAQRHDGERAAGQLARVLGLRGVNNLDFVLHEKRVYLLELNPRPSATLSLYDSDCEDGWIGRHVRACLGELPAFRRTLKQTIRGHRIVYTPPGLTVAPRIRWPAWAKDRPVPGTRLASRAPLCTVLASGSLDELVERRLVHRERTILEMISGACAADGSREIRC
ncbi:MAG: ATP-grasp domain-containing protein [Chromatiaceae bacterium]